MTMTDDENKKRTDLFGDTVAKPLFGDDDAVPAGKPLFDNDFSDPGDAAFVKPLFGDDEEDEPLSLDDFQEFDNVPDSDDAEFEDDGVPEEEPVSGEIPAPEDVPVEEVPAEPPVPEEVPAAQPVTEQSVDPKPAVIDLMTQKCAWRTAVPGAPVKDVRGAIALMDRVLFINSLFGTDPIAFQEALTQINQMQTLDEAVNYLSVVHPEWDFDSDIVYSFMMAVRRKVN